MNRYINSVSEILDEHPSEHTFESRCMRHFKYRISFLGMMTGRPPSYLRYQQNHPPLTVHLTKEIHDLLDDIRGSTGMSYAQLIKGSLNNSLMDLKNLDNLLKEEYSKGYRKGKAENEIWFYCDVCGQKVTVDQNSKSHKAMIQYMKEHHWGHTACH